MFRSLKAATDSQQKIQYRVSLSKNLVETMLPFAKYPPVHPHEKGGKGRARQRSSILQLSLTWWP